MVLRNKRCCCCNRSRQSYRQYHSRFPPLSSFNTAALFFSSIRLSGVLKLSVNTSQSSGRSVSHDGPRHQSFFFSCQPTLPWNQGQLGFLLSSSTPNLLCQSTSKSRSLYGARLLSFALVLYPAESCLAVQPESHSIQLDCVYEPRKYSRRH